MIMILVNIIIYSIVAYMIPMVGKDPTALGAGQMQSEKMVPTPRAFSSVVFQHPVLIHCIP